MSELVNALECELNDVEAQLRTLNERRLAIRNLLQTYDGAASLQGQTGVSMTTIGMAESILEDRKAEMGATEIGREIRKRFGIKPASSLQQMLYGRANKGKKFYRNSGKYGLLRWRAK